MKASACFAISALRSCMSLTTFTSPNVSPDTCVEINRPIGTARLVHAHTQIHGASAARVVLEKTRRGDRQTGMEIWHYLFRQERARDDPAAYKHDEHQEEDEEIYISEA